MKTRPTLTIAAFVTAACLSPGCGTSEPTAAVSKVAAAESDEFRKAQEEAERYHQQKKQEEARQRTKKRLPAGE